MAKKIANTDVKEWKKIFGLPKDNPERRAKESDLYFYIDQHPQDLPALIVALGLNEDVYLKNFYTAMIRKQVLDKQDFDKRDLASYALGLYALVSEKRGDYRDEFINEIAADMIDAYPLRGRVLNWLIRRITPENAEEAKKAFYGRFLRA